MTIAVTNFDGLCGFRPLKEISHFFSTVPSLRTLIGESTANEFEEATNGQEASDSQADVEKNKKALQAAFSALMKSDKSTVASAAKDLVESAAKDADNFAGGGGPTNGGKELADLVIRLNSQFEGDIGLFVLFFLNYVKLEVGEAMFLKADDIHAYLSGGTSTTSSSLSPPSFPPFPSSQAKPTHAKDTRHNRMHGLLRQRRPRWFYPQISGHTHTHHNANILLRSHQRAENASRRLSLRHAQHNCLLRFLLSHPLRPSYRGIQRREDRIKKEEGESYLRGHCWAQHFDMHKRRRNDKRGAQD